MSWIVGLFGKDKGSSTEIASALDLVIYAAGLASSSQAIDSTLNEVRLITAQMQPAATIPAAAQKQLLQAYLDIEGYLINNEPLRAFSKERLRRRVSEPLVLALKQYETARPV